MIQRYMVRNYYLMLIEKTHLQVFNINIWPFETSKTLATEGHWMWRKVTRRVSESWHLRSWNPYQPCPGRQDECSCAVLWSLHRPTAGWFILLHDVWGFIGYDLNYRSDNIWALGPSAHTCLAVAAGCLRGSQLRLLDQSTCLWALYIAWPPHSMAFLG